MAEQRYGMLQNGHGSSKLANGFFKILRPLGTFQRSVVALSQNLPLILLGNLLRSHRKACWEHPGCTLGYLQKPVKGYQNGPVGGQKQPVGGKKGLRGVVIDHKMKINLRKQ